MMGNGNTKEMWLMDRLMAKERWKIGNKVISSKDNGKIQNPIKELWY